MSSAQIWYLAVCQNCGQPGRPLPQPFTVEDERDRWAQAHSEATGHDVLLIKQTKGETGKHIEE